MTLLARLRSFMAALVRGRTIERDMEDEWRFHVEARADALAAEGVPRDQAVRRARSEFGDPLRWKEGGREARGLLWIYDVGGDVRYGLRQLRRAPLFAATAVITLALGIGANAAIFSVLNGVILRPLPYPKSGQLMYVTTQFPTGGLAQVPLSAPEYLEFREVNQSFAAIGALAPGAGEVNLTANDGARRVRSVNVDEHLLNALGVQAAQGRLFARGETDRSDPAAPLPPGRDSLARVVASRVWRAADRRADGGGEQPAARSDRHHAAWRRCHGYPAGNLAATRVEPAQPRGSPRSPPACDWPVERPRHGGGSRRRN